MKRYFVTPQAYEDLITIWQYHARESKVYASALLDELDRRSDGLVDYPEIGPLYTEVYKELRCLPCGQYLIFYRGVRDRIEIVRYLHGARDVPHLFS